MSRMIEERIQGVLAALCGDASPKVLADMDPCYGIVAGKAFGATMAETLGAQDAVGKVEAFARVRAARAGSTAPPMGARRPATSASPLPPAAW